MEKEQDLRMERAYWWDVVRRRREQLIRLYDTGASDDILKEKVKSIRDAEFMCNLLIEEEKDIYNRMGCIDTTNIIEL